MTTRSPLPHATKRTRHSDPAIRRLELTVLRRLDGLLQGDHAGLLPGPGTELGDARLYAPGDDMRRIDWAVTARTTEPHVRDTIADRELELRARRRHVGEPRVRNERRRQARTRP